MTKIVSISLGYGLEEKLEGAGYSESSEIVNLIRQLLKAHLESSSTKKLTIKPKKRRVLKNFCPSCKRCLDLDLIGFKNNKLFCKVCNTNLTYPN